MPGPALPENIDTTYTDDPETTPPTVALHQQHHDAIHDVVNRFDKDVVPGAGDILEWDGSLYQPVPKIASAVAITDAAGDFTATDVEGALAELQADNESAHPLAHAQVHGAADHDDTERFLWFEASEQMVPDASSAVVHGTPPNAIRAQDCANTVTQGVYLPIVAPADYVAGSNIGIEIMYVPSGAAAANARLRCHWAVVELGDLVSESGIEVLWTQAIGATLNALAKTTRQNFTPTGLVAGDLLRLAIHRLGADAADTYTGVFGIVGMFVYYSSGG